jgi:hypothetical protein
VITRRSVLLSPAAALLAQGVRVTVNWVWLDGDDFPTGVEDSSVVFTRAYVADPRVDGNRRAALAGKFPTAISQGSPTIESILNDARIPYVEGRDGSGIVVFVGQGEGSGFTERSIRVPVAIRYPGVLTPRLSSGVLLSVVDLMPTVLSLCGIMAPEGTQGRDLAPLLRQQSGDLPESVFVQGERWRTVIRGYDKLVTDLSGVPEYLYHLAEDPNEQTNLVRDPKARLTRDALAALVQLWLRRLSDRIDPSGLKQR